MSIKNYGKLNCCVKYIIRRYILLLVMSSLLTNEDYDNRKKMLEELKTLVKGEQEQIFVILKKYNVDYTENSNGIFFHVDKLNNTVYDEIKVFLVFCQENRKEFNSRLIEMETSRLNLSDINTLE